MTMYREFILRSPEVWTVFASFVKANAKQMSEAGSPMRLIVTTSSTKRNAEQNKRYWGFVLKTIAEQAFVGGKNFSAEIWHEYFARKFGVCDEVILPDGEIVTRRKSTTEMNVGEFAEYMSRVESHATMELGVMFAT